MKVRLDQNICIGCGFCSSVCPEVFAMDDKIGKAKTRVSKTDKPCAKEAAEGCPVHCITISK